MIAERNRRQRRSPRRTGGGAACRCVASLGDYAGFDRFGRVIDHRWYAYAASADRDRYTYGYDRASNRLYRENTLTSGRDESYGYLCPCQLGTGKIFRESQFLAACGASAPPRGVDDGTAACLTGRWQRPSMKSAR